MKDKNKKYSTHIINSVVNTYKKFILWLPNKFLILHSYVIKFSFLDALLTIVDKRCYCQFHVLAIKYDEKTIFLRFIAKFLIVDKYFLYSLLRVL